MADIADPRITIAIPVFNRTHLVRRAVESILSQGAENIEILVVDDASDEDVFGTISQYANQGLVKYIRNETNLGLVRNWNKCLQLATGDIVNVLHSDEYLESDAIQRVRACFRGHTDLGLVYSDHSPDNIYVASGPKAARLLCDGGCVPSSVFILRKCIDACGLYDEEFSYAPDEEYYPRIATRFGIMCVQPPLARPYNHRERYMMRTWGEKDFLDQCRRLRMAARRHAGQAGRDLEDAVLKDLARGFRFAAAYSLQWGDKTLFRHCYRLGANTCKAQFTWKERLHYYSSFIPGGYELLRRVSALKRMARRGVSRTHLRAGGH